MSQIVIASILFLVSIGVLVVSIRSFKEKGFLFNNAYIYASKQEREDMNKKPYYRQSAIVFLLVSIIFLLNGIGVILTVNWIFFMVMAIAVIAIIYVIISSIAIERKKGSYFI